MICFLAGPVQGGKTTAAGEIVSAARKAGVRVGGILCPGKIVAGARTSINVMDLSTGEASPLADPSDTALRQAQGGERRRTAHSVLRAQGRRKPSGRTCTRGPGSERVGRFHLTEEGLEFGRRALRSTVRSRAALAVVDEVGLLELAGRGWATEINRLVDEYRAYPQGMLLLIVRERLLDRARAKWGLESAPVVRADDPGGVGLVLGNLPAEKRPGN